MGYTGFVRSVIRCVLTAAIWFPVSSRAAATAPQMAQAMDVPTNSIVSALLSPLAGADAVNVAVDWGTVTFPQAGSNFAVMSTGKALDENSIGYVAPAPGTSFSTTTTNPFAGQVTCGGVDAATAHDFTQLTLTLVAPANARGFSVQFKFYSAEYPESVCTTANDRFAILLSSSAYNGNIAFDTKTNPISVNTVEFTATNAAQLAGTGMQNVGAGTDWLTATANVVGGETIVLKFLVFDALDSTVASLAVIDNFQWRFQVAPPSIQIGSAVQLKWPTVTNQVYQVQYATTLNTNSWTNLGSPVTGNGSTNVVFDPVSDPTRIYRIVLQ